MDLETLRNEIDTIDQELVRLFCQRMEVAAKIADYKKANGFPIYHPGREQEVLLKVAAMADSNLSEYIQSLYSLIFELSKRYQSAHNAQDGRSIEVIL